MSRWERRLAEEADVVREEIERRAASGGDGEFTNVTNTFIGWRLLLTACAVIAAASAVLLLIFGLLLALFRGPE
jgi:hypothetical protein